MKKIGIDAISFYVPTLKVEMQDLAERRNIPYEKLNRGLGLQSMAVPDVNEDAASFAANALLKLFEDNNLDPREIGRIYLGTESAVDGSKPTATYAIETVEGKLSSSFGERSFKNCDVVDMTFACIGAVDALHNSMDWVRGNENRKAIVIASDLSKYELLSTGEYTQGAGAVAVLITHNPSIIAIDDVWGVATKSEGDFFKPRRTFRKSSILKEVVSKLNLNYSDEEVGKIFSDSESEFWSDPNHAVEVFREEPVFDGQFSNQCYSDRITEAFEHFANQKNINFLTDWNHFIFHLPYAFHGRRIVFDNWLQWLKANNQFDKLVEEVGAFDEENKKDWLKRASKSNLYRNFVASKIAAGEKASSLIGNMYTASIFMSLLSLLCDALESDIEIENNTIGFIAYGSGSKSKVFQGTVQGNWKEKVNKVQLFEYLNSRTTIDIDTYEQLHKSQLVNPISNGAKVIMTHVENGETNKGLRRYSIN
jgi:hydroxymethylglutaryl-CoA synthase